MNNHDLSADEQRIAFELAGLTDDPDRRRRARIMSAVRSAPAPPRGLIGPWRLVIAAFAALSLLVASSVGGAAASANALPSSPNYALRSLSEQVRLTLADPTTREQLRITFAQSRISQARDVLQRGDRSNAQGLLRDSHRYLTETKLHFGDVSSGEHGAIQNQLNHAEEQQNQAEAQLNQQGEQGQHGG